MVEINNKVIYTFRFTASNQRLQLEQNQLDRIPYLSALVTHKDDFLSTQNANGEYILNPPIHYTWFMAVLHSAISEQAYTLFTELSENENILDTIQLFDYLGINSFNSSLLKEKHLDLSNHHPPPANDDDETIIIGYYCTNVTEARNIAAELIIAISYNVYDLSHIHELKQYLLSDLNDPFPC